MLEKIKSVPSLTEWLTKAWSITLMGKIAAVSKLWAGKVHIIEIFKNAWKPF